ncbi:MAG: hypothetical protein FWE36_08475 [Erysipelotrichales bacterium]|nr:hypothetical protein [Erysipelotrichales bacterium]
MKKAIKKLLTILLLAIILWISMWFFSHYAPLDYLRTEWLLWDASFSILASSLVFLLFTLLVLIIKFTVTDNKK